MANSSYQEQLTQIYNKLAEIQGVLAKLALMSNVNTVQSGLQSQMNTLAGRLDTLTGIVEKLQLSMNDLLIEIRSK